MSAVNPAPAGNVGLCSEQKVALARIGAVVVFKSALDVDRMHVVTAEQIKKAAEIGYNDPAHMTRQRSRPASSLRADALVQLAVDPLLPLKHTWSHGGFGVPTKGQQEVCHIHISHAGAPRQRPEQGQACLWP